MNKKYAQSVTSEFSKVLSSDKDKVHHDETRETTTKLPCLTSSGFHQSEEKCNCHIYVTSVMIITLILFLLEQSAL